MRYRCLKAKSNSYRSTDRVRHIGVKKCRNFGKKPVTMNEFLINFFMAQHNFGKGLWKAKRKYAPNRYMSRKIIIALVFRIVSTF